MSFNFTHVTNNEFTTTDLAQVAKDLPFARDLIPFTHAVSPIITNGGPSDWDLAGGGFHWARLYFNHVWGDKPWRIYYCANDSNGVFNTGFAEAESPTGPWVKYAGNPVLTATEPWEDASYATGGLCIVNANSRLEGFYQYVDSNGDYASARAVSTDGITWTDKQPTIFDASVTNVFDRWCAIVGVIYEPLNKRYIGLIHGSGGRSAMRGATVVSYDGINWSLLGVIEEMRTRFADQNDIEPSDATHIMKVGNVYVAFGHSWVRASDTTKPLWYAVSLDAKHWYVHPEPIALPNKLGAVYKYPHFIQTHDKFYGVYTRNKDVNLIEIDMASPYSTTVITEDTLATNQVVQSKNTLRVKKGERVELNISASLSDSSEPLKVELYPVSKDGLKTDTMPNQEIMLEETGRKTVILSNPPSSFDLVVNNQTGGSVSNLEVTLTLI